MGVCINRVLIMGEIVKICVRGEINNRVILGSHYNHTLSSLHNNCQITVDILETYFPNTANSEENYFIYYQIIYLHKLSIIFL